MSFDSRRVLMEAHLMVRNFLETCGYDGSLAAFDLEAEAFLGDIPRNMSQPQPLIEMLNDKHMADLQRQLSGMRLPSKAEEHDFEVPGDGSMPDTLLATERDIHHSNIIVAKTALVAVTSPEAAVPVLATAAADRTVKLTVLDRAVGEYQPGQVARIFQPHQGVVLDIDFHPHVPHLMLTSSMDKSTVLTNAITGQQHQIFHDHSKFVTRARFAMNGNLIVTGSHDRTVVVYKVVPGSGDSAGGMLPVYAKDKEFSFKGTVEGFCVLPPSPNRPPTVVIGTRDDNYLHYIDLVQYTTTRFNMNANSDDWVSFTPLEISASPHNDGAYLLVSTDSASGRQILFRTGSSLQLQNYYGVPTDGFSTTKHAWDRSGKYFFVSGNDFKIYCFEVGGQQKIVGKLEGHTAAIRGLFMDQERRLLISCSFDKTVRLWGHHSDLQVGQRMLGRQEQAREDAVMTPMS
ncbi:hypothetical protein DFQ27_003430 [Actinomortierella ambigua]|uniref:WD40 repeat-like protein n=1 Tax=Actinomortierella ambigua TaxID=1343610 RepID=A0A9P6U5J2_9FUNG|nr:hypothetical protein DFQ27_003430 [Actinomortierella ambigua]